MRLPWTYCGKDTTNQFERRRGAIQFGIKTAVSLNINSPTVGRVVVVRYIQYGHQEDSVLARQLMTDFSRMCLCPRWKLVVDTDLPFGQ